MGFLHACLLAGFEFRRGALGAFLGPMLQLDIGALEQCQRAQHFPDLVLALDPVDLEVPVAFGQHGHAAGHFRDLLGEIA